MTQELTIGRNPENDIIMSDPSVSRRHACLLISNSSYSVQDNGSANGTYINGMRINGMAQLRKNDILKVGNSLVPWMNYITSESELMKTSINQNRDVYRSAPAQVERNLPNATGALTCGIIGIVLSLFGFVGIIGFILCIISVSIGGNGVGKYNRNPNEYTKSSYNNAKAGMVLGIIGISLFIIAIIIVLTVLNY
jgi:tetrahydromethanopterin S-methyltransferase subunit B